MSDNIDPNACCIFFCGYEADVLDGGESNHFKGCGMWLHDN